MHITKPGWMNLGIKRGAVIVMSVVLGWGGFGCQNATTAPRPDTSSPASTTPKSVVTPPPTAQQTASKTSSAPATPVAKSQPKAPSQTQSRTPAPKEAANKTSSTASTIKITPVEVPIKAVEVKTQPVGGGPAAQAGTRNTTGIPKITVNSRLYDYGDVGVSSKNTAEFQITNEGTAPLKITDISKCCGAVITINEHEVSPKSPVDLAPGQVATVQAVYQAPYSPGLMKKEFNIISNDPNTPALTLSIKAKVIAKMEWSPRQIRLSDREANAGFPKIHIKALDGKPFSIRRFWSTGDAVSLNFDPNVTATEMTVQPQVDMAKLKATPEGRIRFYLSRQDYYALECYYEVIKPYSTNPASFLLFRADPNKPVQKKLWILDNYAQEENHKVSFEIESIKTLEYDMAKIVSQKPLKDGIEVILEMTPPDPLKVRSHMFSDKLEIRIKNASKPIDMMVKGFYTAEIAAKVRKLYETQK